MKDQTHRGGPLRSLGPKWEPRSPSAWAAPSSKASTKQSLGPAESVFFAQNGVVDGYFDCFCWSIRLINFLNPVI